MTLLSPDTLWLALVVTCAFLFTQHRLVPPKWVYHLAKKHGLRHWRGASGFAVLAIAALVLFPSLSRVPDGILDIVIYLNAAWFGLSIAWSDNRFRTARRLGVLAICALLALGMAVRYPLETRIAFVALCSAALAATSFLAAISRRHFLNPFSGRYDGLALPNQQACLCTFVILCTACLVELDAIPLPIGTLLVAAALLLLFLTNTTTEIASGFAAVVLWLMASLIQSASVSWFIAGIALGYVAAHLIVNGIPKFRKRASHVSWAFEHHPVMAHVNLGKDPRTINTLTGRIPLWKNMLSYSRRRWLLGYGYDGFWESHRAPYLARWRATNSHSIYVDALIGLGVIGLALVLALFAAALGVSGQLPPPLSGFLIAFIVFVGLTGLLDSIFFLGGFESFAFLLLLINIGPSG